MYCVRRCPPAPIETWWLSSSVVNIQKGASAPYPSSSAAIFKVIGIVYFMSLPRDGVGSVL